MTNELDFLHLIDSRRVALSVTRRAAYAITSGNVDAGVADWQQGRSAYDADAETMAAYDEMVIDWILSAGRDDYAPMSDDDVLEVVRQWARCPWRAEGSEGK